MTETSVFAEVRAQCAAVAHAGRFVRVREDRIADYARSLPMKQLAAPSLDPSSHFIGTSDQTLSFFITLDAINFGSGYFPHLAKLPGKSGYFTVATHLTNYFRAHGPIGARRLAEISADDCRALFHQQSDAGPVDALMALFARALNELGRCLIEHHGGSFNQLVAAADQSAGKLVALLSQMQMFRDVADLDGMAVPFYKRAQLTAADLNLSLGGAGLGRFNDLDQLTIFADNLVPHVLRCDGVLEYEALLGARIDSAKLLDSGSREEIEIRAAAVHASELIVNHLRRAGHAMITAMQIDYLLWNRGQQPEYKSRPRHRARSWFY